VLSCAIIAIIIFSYAHLLLKILERDKKDLVSQFQILSLPPLPSLSQFHITYKLT